VPWKSQEHQNSFSHKIQNKHVTERQILWALPFHWPLPSWYRMVLINRPHVFINCMACGSCEWCSSVQLPTASVQMTHTHTFAAFRRTSHVNTCLAILLLYHRLGSFRNSHNFFRPLGNFISEINILFTYNIACTAVYNLYTAVHVAYVFNSLWRELNI